MSGYIIELLRKGYCLSFIPDPMKGTVRILLMKDCICCKQDIWKDGVAAVLGDPDVLDGILQELEATVKQMEPEEER